MNLSLCGATNDLDLRRTVCLKDNVNIGINWPKSKYALEVRSLTVGETRLRHRINHSAHLCNLLAQKRAIAAQKLLPFGVYMHRSTADSR